MAKTLSFISSMFNRLFCNNSTDDTVIDILNSTDVTISGNIFHPTYYVYPSTAEINNKLVVPPIKGLKYEESIVHSSLERAEKNNDYLEQFIFYCNKQSIIPMVRCYAFFSHLSTIRKRSDMNDYNQLILDERDKFHEMLKCHYNVRLIISLDIPTILSKWYHDLDSAINRITDLIDNIDDIYEENNIDIVIDEKNSMDGQFILHNALFIHALNADRDKKYNITKYETDETIIANAISSFDERFNYLKIANQQVKKHMQASSMSMFIKHTLDARVEEWYRKIDNNQ